MFIELHMIQNFVPSNLNRDDTNNPKDCEFGGHRRARISSQSLKRAIRLEPTFAQTTKANVGERTKWLFRRINQALMEKLDVEKEEQDRKAEVQAVALEFTRYYAGKKGKMDTQNGLKTNVLLYLSQEEIDLIVSNALDNWEEVVLEATAEKPATAHVKNVIDKNIIPRVKQRTSAPDIALFGRMLADQPDLEIDAACQVAHAISTHRISMEMDFYTAVDDLKDPEEDAEEGAGAAMVGFTSYNSACFYRYARIDWKQLVKNLSGDVSLAQRTVEGFLRAAIDAIPTGKQNSFAAQNPTSLAIAIVREDGKSWNLANAFENPVRPRGNTGLIEPSIQALDTFWGNLTRTRDDASFTAVSAYTDQYPNALNELQPYYRPNISGWISAVNAALPKE